MKKWILINIITVFTLMNFITPNPALSFEAKKSTKINEIKAPSKNSIGWRNSSPDILNGSSEMFSRKPVIENYSEKSSETNAFQEESLSDFIPGELLISVSLCECSNKKLQGREYLEIASKITRIIEESSEFPIKKINNLEPALINKMAKNNMTRQQAIQDIYETRAKAKNTKSSQVINPMQDTIKLLIQFTDTRVDLDKMAQQIEKKLRSVQGISHFEDICIEKNRLYKASFNPNDPLYPDQWSHERTQAPDGWDIERGSASVKIAVIDTGAAYDHPDLAENILFPGGNSDFVDIEPNSLIESGFELIPQEDYTVADAEPKDFNGHGTHCAGIIAGKGNNLTGIAGTCHDCSIIPLRAGFSILLYGQEYVFFSNAAILSALDKAIVEGADIISMSFNGGHSLIQQQKIEEAYNANILLVAAAGNDNTESLDQAYPAALTDVLAVASTNINDTRAAYSNYGDWISVCAPGGDNDADQMILSTVPLLGGANTHASGYKTTEGTSMAASYVAGLAGLILSKAPSVTNDQARSIIESSADNIDDQNPGYIEKLGTGRVNVYQAMHLIETFQPIISISGKRGSDSQGNKNGKIELNEIIELTLSLKNDGFSANNIVASIAPAPDENRLLIDPAHNSFNYGTMGFGQIKTNTNNAFEFKMVSGTVPPIPALHFVLTVTSDNGYEKEIPFTVDDSIFWAGEIFQTRSYFHPELPAPLASVCGHDIPSWGDYDNDGDLDLVFQGNLISNQGGLKLYRNDGFINGEWKFTDMSPSGVIPGTRGVHQGQVVWGDFNNDGKLDLISTGYTMNYGPSSNIYKNTGNSFSPLSSTAFPAPAVYNSTVAWGDYNNDGFLDVLLTGFSNNNGRISRIYKNNGNETFTDIGSTKFPAPGVEYSSCSWGDYNNDGYLDVLLTGQSDADIISRIYKNNGDETFTDIGPTKFPAPGVKRATSTWGDYNNDGYLDVLLTGMTNSNGRISRIYKNNGDGAFIHNNLAGLTGFSSETSTSAAWGDYDNDGLLDIILAGDTDAGSNNIIIYHNNGDETFTNNQSLVGLQFLGGSSAWGDYDNDGYLDLVVLGGSTIGSKIYHNSLGGNPNTRPEKPLNITTSFSGNDVTITWSKAEDEQTPQDGLSYNLYMGTTPLGFNIVSPMSHVNNGTAPIPDGYRKIAAMGGQNKNVSWTIKNVPPGNYYCGVQAVDTGLMGSPFAQQDFSIGANNYVIEGKVYLPDGVTPLAGVVLSVPGLPQETTNNEGFYQFIVESSWEGGTVIPHKSGIGSFSPNSRTYPPLNSNQYNQNYISSYELHTITIKTDETPGATITDGGTPATTLTYTVVGGGSFSKTITAQPPVSHNFVNWTGYNVIDPTNPVLNLSIENVTEDITITANFAIKTFTLTYTADPKIGGTVSLASETVSYGANGSEVIATANPGYQFTHWGGDVYTTNSSLQIMNVTQNMNAIANFTQLTNHTITIKTDGTPGATVTDGGIPTATLTYTVFEGGSFAKTITAQQPVSHNFVNWTGYTIVDPTNPVLDLSIENVTEDITITANFVINNFTITGKAMVNGELQSGVEIVEYVDAINPNGKSGGSQNGTRVVLFTTGAEGLYTISKPFGYSGKIYAEHQNLTFAPVFYEYSDLSNNQINKDYAALTRHTITIKTDGTQDAFLQEGTAQPRTILTYLVEHGKPFNKTLSALAPISHQFKDWTGDIPASSANPLTINLGAVTQDLAIVANFTIKRFMIEYFVQSGGTVDIDAEWVDYGQDGSSVTATPDNGYQFSHWEGSVTTTDNPLKIQHVTSNMNVTAEFSLLHYYDIIIKTDGTDGALVSDGTQTANTLHYSVKEGDPFNKTITATPPTTHVFKDWANASPSYANPIALSIPDVQENLIVTANFVPKNSPFYTISGHVYLEGTSMPVQGVKIYAGEAPYPSGDPAAVTGADGSYSFTKAVNWQGYTVPFKNGYNFTPQNKYYSKLHSDQMYQDFEAIDTSITISGRVYNNLGSLEEVDIYVNNTKKTTTDLNGFYTLSVPYGTSNLTVHPQLGAETFTPQSITYLETLTTNKQDQDFLAKNSYNFGRSLGFYGNTIMAGMFSNYYHWGQEYFQGFVHVFTQDTNTGSFIKTQRLMAHNGKINDHFGESVSLYEDWAVIGAPNQRGGAGSAYLFKMNEEGVWTEKQEITPLQGSSQFGYSVSISGDTLIVGSKGGAYIYVKNPESDIWTHAQSLTTSTQGGAGFFGHSVSISGNTAVVGAPERSFGCTGYECVFAFAGAAFIYVQNSDGTWPQTETQELRLNYNGLNDRFGYSVAIHEGTAVIGALKDSVWGDLRPGTVYIFERNTNGTWNALENQTLSNGIEDDHFGFSVGLSSNTLVVGAPNVNATFFERSSAGAWIRKQFVISHGGQGQKNTFGYAVAISNDDRAVIGAPHWDDDYLKIGAAYYYKRGDQSGIWPLAETQKLDPITITDPTRGDREKWLTQDNVNSSNKDNSLKTSENARTKTSDRKVKRKVSLNNDEIQVRP